MGNAANGTAADFLIQITNELHNLLTTYTWSTYTHKGTRQPPDVLFGDLMEANTYQKLERQKGKLCRTKPVLTVKERDNTSSVFCNSSHLLSVTEVLQIAKVRLKLITITFSENYEKVENAKQTPNENNLS